MPFRGRVVLSKEQVRRIVLAKLRIVYRDWRLTNRPFGRRDPNAGRRREDAQSFETALVAAVVCRKLDKKQPSCILRPPSGSEPGPVGQVARAYAGGPGGVKKPAPGVVRLAR